MKRILRAFPRYAKRVVLLPWNFHKHFQAENAHRAAVHVVLHEQSLRQMCLADGVRQVAAHAPTDAADLAVAKLTPILVELVGQAERAVAGAVTANLQEAVVLAVRGELASAMHDCFRDAVAGPVQAMLAEFRTRLAEMELELRSLNDRHAACYDRIAVQLRAQTAQLEELAGPAEPEYVEGTGRLRLRA